MWQIGCCAAEVEDIGMRPDPLLHFFYYFFLMVWKTGYKAVD